MDATELWVLFQVIDTGTKWEIISSYIQKKLLESDWTQLSDSGLNLSQQITWMEYRQALKELQITYPNPDDVVFPTQPDGERP